MNQELKNKSELEKHLEAGEQSADPHYVAWKKQIIETALEQSKDRSTLVPANKVWQHLKIEY
jgi:hypothetical protein